MSGILFLKTKQLHVVREFYQSQISCELWQDQGDCVILRHGNFLFGFCERETVDTSGMLTFFYDSKEEVDRMYALLEPISTTQPKMNDKYNIYQFFATDPEGRALEFQYFADRVSRYRPGDDLLLTRRSVREFTTEKIPGELMEKILDISRFAPTARNSQPYYFKIIKDPQLLTWLSTVRGSSTGPIGRAPLAVAICSDPAVSGRYDHDACIATYHFILAAWFYGLGTCWIGGMNTAEVKEKLDIPTGHYLATVTPLGYPKEEHLPVPERKNLADYIRS